MNNIFDVIKNITSVKREEDLGTDLFNPYMTNRFLSMSEDYIVFSVCMNRYAHMNREMQELFLFHAIPKKYNFFKYHKKEKSKAVSVTKIIEELNVSDKKALEISEFMNNLNDKKNGM